MSCPVRPLRRRTLAAAVGLVVLIVLLKISELPSAGLFAWKGLMQRVLLTLYLAWLFTLVLFLARRLHPSP